jgi:high-affinity iron transporter
MIIVIICVVAVMLLGTFVNYSLFPVKKLISTNSPAVFNSAFGAFITVIFYLIFSSQAFANPKTAELSPITNIEKETRQLLQLAEYIGVDYSAAVAQGKIINVAEFAEMQQFANIIADKADILPNSEKQNFTSQAQALKTAIANKSAAIIVQQQTKSLRNILLSVSPNLALPVHLLSKSQQQNLFVENCASCHGESGNGNGLLAKQLTPEPTDFTDRARAMNRSLLGLYDAITNGLAGSAMTAFSNLNEKERWSLAFYVGGLAFDDNIQTPKNIPKAITLETFINNNPTNLLQQFPAINLAEISLWRSQPELFFNNENNPLATTRSNLFSAVNYYKQGNLKQAQTLAVSAYLDGFELIENSLDAHEPVLRKSIEGQLLNFRNLLAKPAQENLVNEELSQILQQLTLAEQLLSSSTLSNKAIFSAAAVILLREGLEALLVVIALATVLMRTGRQDALKYVHLGWISALALGAFTWWAAENLITISGASRELMEGGAALLAALVLFYVGYWMQGKTQAAQWQSYIKTNLDRHLNSGTLWGIAGLAFISVYREVFETVLFYQSLLTQVSDTSVGSGQFSYVISGLFTGVAVLALIAWLMIRYSVKLPITKFFAVSAYFMLILAFILTGKGIAALQEAAIIGLSPFPIDLSISWLGVSATWQGLLAQTTILVLTALLMLKKNETPLVNS